MELHQLVYSSIATQDMSAMALGALLEESRINNAVRGVTGMLIYYRQQFTQLLEGDKKDIFALYDRIVADRRNQKNILMWDEPITERFFPKWSMAFLVPEESAIRDRLGYSDFLEARGQLLGQSATISVGKKFLFSLRDDFLMREDDPITQRKNAM